MRLKSRAVTQKSGPEGVNVIVKQLSKTSAVLEISEVDRAALPLDERETFTVDVQLEKSHPFESRFIHCLATVSAITMRNNGDAEVYVAIQEMSLRITGETKLSSEEEERSR